MPSLTTCLKKAGAALDPADKAAIIARARELRLDGTPATEAAQRSVDEQISYVQDELARLEGEDSTLQSPA